MNLDENHGQQDCGPQEHEIRSVGKRERERERERDRERDRERESARKIKRGLASVIILI